MATAPTPAKPTLGRLTIKTQLIDPETGYPTAVGLRFFNNLAKNIEAALAASGTTLSP